LRERYGGLVGEKRLRRGGRGGRKRGLRRFVKPSVQVGRSGVLLRRTGRQSEAHGERERCVDGFFSSFLLQHRSIVLLTEWKLRRRLMIMFKLRLNDLPSPIALLTHNEDRTTFFSVALLVPPRAAHPETRFGARRSVTLKAVTALLGEGVEVDHESGGGGEGLIGGWEENHGILRR
jgi:hypothetical protein